MQKSVDKGKKRVYHSFRRMGIINSARGMLSEGRDRECLKYVFVKMSPWKVRSKDSRGSVRAAECYRKSVNVNIMKSRA